MSEALDALEERLGHRFRDRTLLEHALTHRSRAGEAPGAPSNERLEFLGDRVLGLCIAEWLMQQHPGEREGDLGKRISVLVARDTLAAIAARLGVAQALIIAASPRHAALRDNPTVLSDALEALLAAMFLEAGLDPVRALVRREWPAAAAQRPPRSPKTRLQEWTLKRGLGLPEYRTESIGGAGEDAQFRAHVRAAGREAAGEGQNKRAAEQSAAEAWLAGLGA
ncbi:MAG: ribonuclease III [Rubritepida sp.]|jgi:ribonuclease-3|nr:ribonuclease III [Rubritepida sp.]MCU0944517.1 ribonuclease III [Rubritepida sp.]